MKGNLYVMDFVIEKYYISFFNPRDMGIHDWHNFLGHPSAISIRHMQFLEEKLHSEALKAIENCKICIKAKQARYQFHVLERRTQELFELVHGISGGLTHKTTSAISIMFSL